MLLYHDLQRQALDGVEVELDASVDTGKENLTAPILVKTAAGGEFIIALSSPLSTDHAADPAIAKFLTNCGKIPVILENELIVRGNLPAASRRVLQGIGKQKPR